MKLKEKNNTWMVIKALVLPIVFVGYLLLTACGTEEYNMVILGALIPDDQCKVMPPTDATVYRGAGVLDLSYMRFMSSVDYIIALGMENRLVDSEEMAAGQAQGAQTGLFINTRDVSLKELRVSVAPAQGSTYTTSVPEFRIDLGGTIIFSREPSGDPGRAAIVLELLPPYIVEILASDPAVSTSGDAQDILVKVQIIGSTLDGAEVVSSTFQYPVTLCYGCLNGFPSLDFANCPSGGTMTQEASGDVGEVLCLVGQDGRENKTFVQCACPKSTELSGDGTACVRTN